MKRFIACGAKVLSCLAMFVAVVSASGACLFLSYQPEIPEELL